MSWIERHTLRELVAGLQNCDVTPNVLANLAVSRDTYCASLEVNDTLATQKLNRAVNVNCGESKSLADLRLR